MRKLLIGAGLCTLLAVPAWAGEPVKLSSAQMDRVTAGDVCYFCSNYNATYQANYQLALGGHSLGSNFSSNAVNVGINFNSTRQRIN